MDMYNHLLAIAYVRALPTAAVPPTAERSPAPQQPRRGRRGGVYRSRPFWGP